jgi:hypothetical protein
MLGKLEQCWSAFYDGLALYSELEARVRNSLSDGSEPDWPAGMSDATRGLIFSTSPEIAEYFRARRNYLEAVATLDIAICVETVLREDRSGRLAGLKNSQSQLGGLLAGCPVAPGQTEPAARRLLALWIAAGVAVGKHFQMLDDALLYRNWTAHGSLGVPPVNAMSPFLLDQLVVDFIAFVAAEP